MLESRTDLIVHISPAYLILVAAHSKKEHPILSDGVFFFGAGDEARTRYLDLGKVALYQMSYARKRKDDYSVKMPLCQPRIFIFFSRSSESPPAPHFPGWGKSVPSSRGRPHRSAHCGRSARSPPPGGLRC